MFQHHHHPHGHHHGHHSLQWVPGSQGYIPPYAVQGGYDVGDNIYVGRAHHYEETVPGKLVPSHHCCYISFGGSEHCYHQYEVLTNPQNCHLSWQHAYGGNIPPGAVPAGNSRDGETMYIGRHHHEGTMTVGKVHPSHNCLYVPFGGNEHRYNDYEILICH